MKILLVSAAAIASLLILAPLRANEPALSKRVGQTVDKKEREYFSLFPAVGNFLSAQLETVNDSTSNFVILTDSADNIRSRTLPVSLSALREINNYIENYENPAPSDPELIARLTGGIGGGNFNYNKSLTTRAVLLDGEDLSGQLVYADSLMIVLWISRDDFDWFKAGLYSRPLSYSDIELVEINGASLNVNGNLRRFRNAGPDLSANCCFHPVNDKQTQFYPPELNAIIKKKKTDMTSNPDRNSESVKLSAREIRKVYSVSFNFAPLVNQLSQNSIKLSKPFSLGNDKIVTTEYIIPSLSMTPNISLSYLFGDNLNLCLGLNYNPGNDFAGGSHFNLKGYLTTLSLEYFFKRYNPMLSSKQARMELSGSAGLTYGYYTLKTLFPYLYANSLAKIDNTLISQTIGAIVCLQASYYLLNSLSVNLSADLSYMPTINYPEIELSVYEDSWQKVVPKVKINGSMNLSAIHVFAGVRYHFNFQ